MNTFLATVLVFFAILGHGYLWVAIVNRLHGWNGPRKLIDGLTLLSCVGFILLPVGVGWYWWKLRGHYLTQHESHLLAAWTRDYVMACALVGLSNLLARCCGGLHDDDPSVVLSTQISKPTFPRHLRSAVYRGIYPRLLGLIPLNESLRLSVETKRIAIPKLPETLRGLRIAHLSDLHLTGRMGPEWFNFVADEVNRLDVDAIAITGDLIENAECREWLTACLGRLRARLGVYFILGNHDHYVDANQTISQLTAAGLTYLGAKSIRTQWRGVPVLLAGNGQPWATEPPDLKNSNETPHFSLLLLHTPDLMDWATAVQGDLALAGHTHGGQVCFPLLGAVAVPSLYGTRFARGTFRRGRTILHVTRGISGETPLRWNCPPEIAVLELECGH